MHRNDKRAPWCGPSWGAIGAVLFCASVWAVAFALIAHFL